MPGALHGYAAPETYGRYGIRVELQAYFSPPAALMQLESQRTGRLKADLGSQLEEITARDFVAKIDEPLKQAGMTHVTTFEIDDYYVLWSEVETKENLDDAIRTALASTQIAKDTAEVYIVSNGTTKDFKFEQDVTFRPKHPFDHPPISILVRAVPAEWIPLAGEDLQPWSERLSTILKDKEGVARLEVTSRTKMQQFIEDYKRELAGVFPIARFAQELMIDLSAVSVKDFKKEARIERRAFKP